MICDQLKSIRRKISKAEHTYHRIPDSVQLLAVSKTKPVSAIEEAYACGQRAFGENYAQELLDKTEALKDLDIEWHYIGPLQSNKTRIIAEHADWMHSIDREKIARRISDQRPASLPPLNICLQVNISGEESKSGVRPVDLPELARSVNALPGIRLRGIMTLPAPSSDFDEQRAAFARVKGLFDQLNEEGLELDTLSMGMTGDLEAAIAEGSTMVRIGTAIFGARDYPRKD
jgi:pyridoxal phosphate enzyme (YggS family)